MPLKALHLCLFLLLSCSVSVIHAKPLQVGITTVPPFAMQNEQGEWQGISIDLWRAVAREQQLDFEWVPLSFTELLSQVESGQIDVAVGALTMTADREAVFDFSHPFYQTGLAIAVPPSPKHGIMHSLKALFSWEFLSVIAALTLLLFVVGTLLWFCERRANPDQFGGKAREGIGASFWWAAVTMTTVGYGDKAPVTLAGRMVALVWMFAGLIMVASFTAAITTSLTVSNLQYQIQGPQDLPGNRVATITGTASAQYLQDNRIIRREYANLSDAMHSVLDGETDAVVYDRPLLQFRNQQLAEQRLTLVPGVFDQQLYALAMPAGSKLRAAISEEILRITESQEWSAIQASYLQESK
ncbi:MAG: transporter substrate-binding domain-containing protein [Halopseudomonas sp.]|uniref:transporter substrate-binding domain-containing protein n=1 Tax=Halopseudomonas sp. TaxID=2901191 RepID=UPI003002DFF9